jgi:hypothetical protein
MAKKGSTLKRISTTPKGGVATRGSSSSKISVTGSKTGLVPKK